MDHPVAGGALWDFDYEVQFIRGRRFVRVEENPILASADNDIPGSPQLSDVHLLLDYALSKFYESLIEHSQSPVVYLIVVDFLECGLEGL